MILWPETFAVFLLQAGSCVCLGGVAIGCWICDQRVAGSNPSHPALECNPGKVVNKQYNLVPANGRRWLVARKVTVGLASHWPRVTDISGSPPTCSRPGEGDEHLPTLSCGTWLTLPFTCSCVVSAYGWVTRGHATCTKLHLQFPQHSWEAIWRTYGHGDMEH